MIELAVVGLATFFALVSPAITRPTLPFGVQIAATRVGDPMVVKVRRVYTWLVILAATVAAILTVSLRAGPTVTAMAVIGVDAALYYLAYRWLRMIKRREWWAAEHRYGVTVDTTFRTNPVRVPCPWLLPALLVMVVTLVLAWSRGLEPVGNQAFATLFCVLITVLILRARPDLDAAKPVGSARRYRVYLRGIARAMMLVAAAINLQVLVYALRDWGLVPPTTFWAVVAVVPQGAVILGLLIWQMKVGQAGHRLPALPGEENEETGVVQRDDDRYWYLAGMIYVNRRDPAVLVHRRVGFHWTLNFGNPITWAIVAVLVIVTLLSGFDVINLPEWTEIP